MKKLVLALAVFLVSSSSFAIVIADGMQDQIRCRMPHMADGGYIVTISTGGIAPHTEVKLALDSITGKPEILGNYVVGVFTSRTQDLLFTDATTLGQMFQLVVHGHPRVGTPVPAVLYSNTKAGRVSVNLVCTQLLQSH